MRLYSSIALAAVAAVLVTPVAAEAKTRKHHVAAPATDGGLTTAEQLRLAQEQISQLQAQLNAVAAKLDATAAASTTQVAAANTTATAAATKADKALAAADAVKVAQVKTEKSVKSMDWAAGTKVGGQIFFNTSAVVAHNSSGARVQNDGAFQIKRGYVSVDHTFNKTFAVNVTADVDSLTVNKTVNNGGVNAPALAPSKTEQGFYIKFAYLQAKDSNELIVQAGSEQMPWIPFVENLYGYRFVDKVFVDQNKYGNSADWGVNVHGDLVKGLISYSVSAVDGAGYKNPIRSKTMDWEGRVNLNYNGFVAAIGGYSGQEGNNIQSVPTTAFQTATRFDALVAYVKGPIRLGVEYMDATNWKVTTKVTPDKANGYSAFASYNLNPKWSIFGRYDAQDPSKTLAPAEKYAYYNIGINYEPVKTVDLALVYKHEDISHAPVGGYADGTTTLGPAGGSGKYDEFGIFTQVKY